MKPDSMQKLEEGAQAMWFKSKSKALLDGNPALKKLDKKETMMLQKTLQNITIEQVKKLYDEIPKD